MADAPALIIDRVQVACSALAETSGQAPIFFDYSDLVAYFAANRFPTGIQRVQIELFKASLSWLGRRPIRACAYVPEARWWAEIDAAVFEPLCRLAADTGSAVDDLWRTAVARFMNGLRARPKLLFPFASVLINIGTSWWIDDYMAMIREAKVQSGLFYVPLIHDMIPLIMPERVGDGLPQAFAAWVSSVLMHADVLAANSESTARDVMRFATATEPQTQLPVVMRLDAESRDGPAPPAPTLREMLLDRLGLHGRRFVLFVSTLEVRKNHLLVFEGWLRLLAEGKSDDLPILVCVGNRGWKFDAAQGFLDRHPALAGQVMLLSGVSDAELYTLYTDCLFTVYASLYEGWGLPVTESLCHGKVCLTSNNSSLPEAGGRFGVYFDGKSGRQFVEQARHLIRDDRAREERERLIAAEYRSRSWPEVLRGLIEGVVARIEAMPGPKPVTAAVEFGTAYSTARRAGSLMLDRVTVVAEMMRFPDDWHAAESWGVWSRVPEVRLRFTLPVDCPVGDVLAYIRVRSAIRPVPLTIMTESEKLALIVLPKTECATVRVTIPAALVGSTVSGAGPSLTLLVEAGHMTSLSESNLADIREVGFGLCGFSVCLQSDLVSRMAILDRELMS